MLTLGDAVSKDGGEVGDVRIDVLSVSHRSGQSASSLAICEIGTKLGASAG